MNIICVEPDNLLAKVYQKTFVGDAKDVVRICPDPQGALDQIDAQKPDYIVLEPQLAPLSGFAFLHELRTYEDFRNIPVIIYSSVPKESFSVGKAAWEALGVTHYFYKAVDTPQKVARVLHGEQ